MGLRAHIMCIRRYTLSAINKLHTALQAVILYDCERACLGSCGAALCNHALLLPATATYTIPCAMTVAALALGVFAGYLHAGADGTTICITSN